MAWFLSRCVGSRATAPLSVPATSTAFPSSNVAAPQVSPVTSGVSADNALALDAGPKGDPVQDVEKCPRPSSRVEVSKLMLPPPPSLPFSIHILHPRFCPDLPGLIRPAPLNTSYDLPSRPSELLHCLPQSRPPARTSIPSTSKGALLRHLIHSNFSVFL
jgi:hypothetical protein